MAQEVDKSIEQVEVNVAMMPEIVVEEAAIRIEVAVATVAIVEATVVVVRIVVGMEAETAEATVVEIVVDMVIHI
jgi:hypothetical protein